MNHRIRFTIKNSLFLIPVLFLMIFVQDCKKEELIIIVSTDEVTDIAYTSCIVKGSLLDISEEKVFQYGFCYGESQEPTIDSHTSNLGATFSKQAYVDTIRNLQAGTKYYIRAYALNIYDVYYGDQISFTTLQFQKASIETETPKNITGTSAILGGIISSDGGSTVTERGIYCGTDVSPEINGQKYIMGSDTGVFAGTIPGLASGTTYYVKAYAINSKGISYGSEMTFRTSTMIKVTTAEADGITGTTVILGGEVESPGGEPITERGVYYSTLVNAEKTGTKHTIGNSKGKFSDEISDLMTATTYYCKAYALNTTDTVYGSELQFTTLSSAVVSTTDATDILETSVTLGGNVTSDGGYVVTDRGIYYGKTPDPESTGTKIQMGSGTGNYSGSIGGLDSGEVYFYKAYAINEIGPGYGIEQSFTTRSKPVLSTAEASDITGTSATLGGEVTFGGESDVTERGIYYSTSPNAELTGARVEIGSGTGIFSATVSGLAIETVYYVKTFALNTSGLSYGPELSFSTWSRPTVATSAATDITTSSAVLGGEVSSSGGQAVTEKGVYYSSSSNAELTGVKQAMGSGTGGYAAAVSGLQKGTVYYVKAYATNNVGTAFGVEKLFTTRTVPTVTTAIPLDFNVNSVTVGGEVPEDGGYPVTDRGIYYSTSEDPETTGTKFQIGSGTGTFSTKLPGLQANTTYFLKAYATNEAGTAYGKQFEVRTWMGIVIDYDGNEYGFVQIGEQVWMAQNLRTMHYSDGTEIPLVLDNTEWTDLTVTDTAMAYVNNDPLTIDEQGALYTWAAAMYGAGGSNANPSGVQGACPEGWHLPSYEEWIELDNYLGGTDITGGKMKEQGTTHWDLPNTGASNSSGFSAMGSGIRWNNGSPFDYRFKGIWWSATSTSANQARYFSLQANHATLNWGSYLSKDYGFSIRCVQD